MSSFLAQKEGFAFLRKSQVGCSFPVAVPEKIFGLTLILDFFDRCHSLTSLYLPLAALGSLPTRLLLRAAFQIPLVEVMVSKSAWGELEGGEQRLPLLHGESARGEGMPLSHKIVSFCAKRNGT